MSRWSRLQLDPPRSVNPLTGRSTRQTGDASPYQMILGKVRWQWVLDCARVIYSSTTPEMRWLMFRDGRHVFVERAQKAFSELTPFPLTSSERGQVYTALKTYVFRPDTRAAKYKLSDGRWVLERDLHAGFQDRFDKERNKNPTPEREDETPWDGSDIVVEDKYGRSIPAKDLHLLMKP